MFHECVSMTMSSKFTVPLIIQRIFACTKILGVFPTTMTDLSSFLGVAEASFVDPVGYNVRCRGDCFEHCFEYIYDGFPCNSTGLKCTKYCKINDLVEHVVSPMVPCNKR